MVCGMGDIDAAAVEAYKSIIKYLKVKEERKKAKKSLKAVLSTVKKAKKKNKKSGDFNRMTLRFSFKL